VKHPNSKEKICSAQQTALPQGWQVSGGNGNGNSKEGNGNGNEGGRQRVMVRLEREMARGQWQGWQQQWLR
jgi:hypothetical protein